MRRKPTSERDCRRSPETVVSRLLLLRRLAHGRRNAGLPRSSMGLTGDGHVHTEWSSDVGLGDPHSHAAGLMDSMCRRAVQIGLPALAFTEHLDVTGWAIGTEDLLEQLRPLVGEDGMLTPPLLDAEGYLASVERCRRQFPELRILTGVELGQPHLDEAARAGRRPSRVRSRERLLAYDPIDRCAGYGEI